MSLYRKWYCACSGSPIELITPPPLDEDEPAEPACQHCGATPSSDPRKTVVYRDEDDWED